MFDGFRPAVFEWFAGLERDNSREYFTATRDLYEAEVRGGLEAMFDELTREFSGDVKVFRQHRDLRFTPDKRPYKDRTYGVLGRYYAALSSRGLYAGTGYYRVARDQLERYRAAVASDASGPRLEAALATAGLDVAGMSLKTAPRGYPKDHPRIELLRRKQLIVGLPLPGDGGLSRDAALGHVAGVWRAATPVVDWLDEHVGASTLPPPPGRYGSG
ncbi:MAG TPA: DUF2461 domain-containing protein [Solirubrobacteraceae bacterium]|nr:DUF2461 domain-containing protein [Solirubrobacteraceae bacterium]